MMTPPKDKPVAKDAESPFEADDFQSDEAVAAQDTAIKPASENDEMNGTETESENDNGKDLNVDKNDLGLNSDQGKDFF